MEIIYFDSLKSTHNYLLEALKNGILKPPVCICCDEQTNGIGSRGNSWISLKGNLFLSFCVDLKHLPNDLPLQSTSIYFSYILKELLVDKGSKIWLKWPNDFYIENKKIGGVITVKTNEYIICSIGLNILQSPQNYSKLDILVDKNELINQFIKKIKKNFSWKQIFSKYKIEFQKSKKFVFHYKNEKLSLQDAKLNFDGSISINGRKVFNLR